MAAKGWDAASEAAKKHSGNSGLFLKLADDKDSAQVAFLGDPVTREVVWINGKQEEYDVNKHGDEQPRMVVSINIYNFLTKQVQIFEQGVNWFKTMLRMKEKYGLYSDRWTIQREGSKGSPKTTYVLFRDEPLTDQEKMDLSQCVLNDLERKRQPAEDDDPFEVIDEGIKKEIVAKLKTLGSQDVQTFLEKFKVQRVGEIPKMYQNEASQFVQKLIDAKSVKNQDPFA